MFQCDLWAWHNDMLSWAIIVCLCSLLYTASLVLNCLLVKLGDCMQKTYSKAYVTSSRSSLQKSLMRKVTLICPLFTGFPTLQYFILMTRNEDLKFIDKFVRKYKLCFYFWRTRLHSLRTRSILCSSGETMRSVKQNPGTNISWLTAHDWSLAAQINVLCRYFAVACLSLKKAHKLCSQLCGREQHVSRSLTCSRSQQWCWTRIPHSSPLDRHYIICRSR